MTIAMNQEKTSRLYTGIDICISDLPTPKPIAETQLSALDATAWFQSHPTDGDVAIRLLVHKLDKPPARTSAGFDLPFSRDVIEHALWNPEVYLDLTKSPSGGCAGLSDQPYRFTIQLPDDGLPFVSLALSKRGHVIKGIYTYSDDCFDPCEIISGERVTSGWRSTGLQITSMPQAVLKASSAQLALRLATTLARVRDVERALLDPGVMDFAPLQRSLFLCHDELFTIERRSRFEMTLIEAIETITKDTKYGAPWPSLAPYKAAIQMRQADLETLPKRMEIARIAINDSIIQRAQLQGLEIAQASKHMAEATMNDSASMKTIAVLTMVFLPGTAVASFFSMTMWNWTAASGEALVSPWLWIYFAVAVPFTGAVLAAWWFWTRARSRELALQSSAASFRHRSSSNYKAD